MIRKLENASFDSYEDNFRRLEYIQDGIDAASEAIENEGRNSAALTNAIKKLYNDVDAIFEALNNNN